MTAIKNNTVKLGTEALETRDMMSVSSIGMSGGIVTIYTDNSATSVTVSTYGSGIQVKNTVSGSTWNYTGVSRVDFVGGAGNDRFVNNVSTLATKAWGNGGNDYLEGYNGADYFVGGDGNDTLIGYGGNDQMWGGAGRDDLRGMDGNDQLQGGDGDDILDGGNGNDKMWGDAGSDTLGGGAGDDWLIGGIGVDVAFGGTGSDTFWELKNDVGFYLTPLSTRFGTAYSAGIQDFRYNTGLDCLGTGEYDVINS